MGGAWAVRGTRRGAAPWGLRAVDPRDEANEVEAVAKRALERSELGFPAIGDWVAYVPASGGSDRARIEAVLPRRTKLSRKVPGAKARGTDRRRER